MDIKEKLQSYKARQKNQQDNKGGKNRTKNIYHKMKDGDNIVRLVGNFLETRTHYLVGSLAREKDERGFAIPKVVNCGAWDTENECWKEGVWKNNRVDYKEAAKHCPLCAVFYMANLKSKDNESTEKERERFKGMLRKAGQRAAYKWNCIDRDDPYIIVQKEDKSEEKKLGLKILSVGEEAFKGIANLFVEGRPYPVDAQKGIDIVIKKTMENNRTTYKVEPRMVGDYQVVVSPLTEEEAKLEMFDLKAFSKKSFELAKLKSFFNADFATLLSEYETATTQSAPPSATKEEEPDLGGDEPDLGGDDGESDEMTPDCFKTYDVTAAECKTCPQAKGCEAVTPKK